MSKKNKVKEANKARKVPLHRKGATNKPRALSKEERDAKIQEMKESAVDRNIERKNSIRKYEEQCSSESKELNRNSEIT